MADIRRLDLSGYPNMDPKQTSRSVLERFWKAWGKFGISWEALGKLPDNFCCSRGLLGQKSGRKALGSSWGAFGSSGEAL